MKTETKKQETAPKGKDANRDPISGAPGAHPVGTGVGAAGGAVAGAAVGAIAGPIGAAAGIVVGAVAGGLAGKAVGEKYDPTVEATYWKANFSQRKYVEANSDYALYESAYRTGYEGHEKYPAKKYDEVESRLQTDYEKSKDKAKLGWDKAKVAVRDAWQRVDNAARGDAKTSAGPVNPSRKRADAMGK
jgi:hypothetical protein